MGIRAITLFGSAAMISSVAHAGLAGVDATLLGAMHEIGRVPPPVISADGGVPTPGSGALMLAACVISSRRKRS